MQMPETNQKRYPAKLSGSQRQRVSQAWGLEPQVLLLADLFVLVGLQELCSFPEHN